MVPVCPHRPHFVLAFLHLTTSLSPQLLALFTTRPAPDTEATPYGGYSTSYHSCVRSNLYDKLLSLHHSQRFCFSPQTLTDPGAKTCSMPLPRASQKCSPLEASISASFLAPENFIFFTTGLCMYLPKYILLLKNCTCL